MKVAGPGLERRVLAGIALCTGLLTAATPGLRAQNSAPVTVVAAASYVVGAGDILSMQVAGSPELNSLTMRVDTDGTVHVPFCDRAIPVSGMRHDAIRVALQQALEQCELAVKPSVEINVVDVESKPITLTGSVKQQEVLQAIQPMRLLEALTRAGGVSENAGDIVMVIRHDADGTEHEVSYPAAKVLSSIGPAFNPLLSGGEEVRVLQGGRIYLSGAFNTTAAVPLDDSDPITLRKAIALGHGFAAASKPQNAQLVHNTGQPNMSYETVDLTKIQNGKAPDRLLAANDMVFVPTSGVKRVANDVLGRTAGVLTAAATIFIAQ